MNYFNQSLFGIVLLLLSVPTLLAQQVADKKLADAQQPNSLTADHRTQALLWVQTSLEYEVACRQAYRFAKERLREGLANPAWSAATEQGKDFARKPPAVILDVDETVLDNSPFNGRLIETGKGYSASTWAEWCNEAKAEAVPGAKEFIDFATRSGVEVFFVTNRDNQLKAATAKNLASVLGIAVADDHLLLKGGQPDWTSRKTERRAVVAKTHRILLLIGDDFNDFVSIGKRSPAERVATAPFFETSLGRHWILLPNPLYGSWEKAIYKYNYNRPVDEQRRMRRDSLRTEPSASAD